VPKTKQETVTLCLFIRTIL